MVKAKDFFSWNDDRIKEYILSKYNGQPVPTLFIDYVKDYLEVSGTFILTADLGYNRLYKKGQIHGYFYLSMSDNRCFVLYNHKVWIVIIGYRSYRPQIEIKRGKF